MKKGYLLVCIDNNGVIVDIRSTMYTSLEFATRMRLNLDLFEEELETNKHWFLRMVEIDEFETTEDLHCED